MAKLNPEQLMDLLKCRNPRCRHRIERHEILASGRVICTDCECRDYVLTSSASITARLSYDAVAMLADAIELQAQADGEADADLDFIEGDQWPELPS